MQAAFLSALFGKLGALWQFSIPGTTKILDKNSAPYFRSTREAQFGKTMEELEPSGAARAEEWEKVKKGFSTIDSWLQAGKAEGPFVLGAQPGFADFQVAAFLVWLRTIWGEDSVEWKDIKTWNEGRWLAYVDALKKYQTILI